MSYDTDWDNGAEIKVKKEESPEAERLHKQLFEKELTVSKLKMSSHSFDCPFFFV